MSFEAILLPMFVQVALTFVLLFWTIFLRLRAVRRGEVDPHQIALRQPNWPPHVQQVSNAFHNSVEMPTLFYVVVLLGLMSKTLDVTVYVLMWMFVLSRVVHAVIHVTSNDLRHRTPMFLIGAIALALIWILIAGRIIAFQSLS
ncbi:MAG TPA: MAPEG family protein [Methyloceanibacter sp.]|nr:MAPEG family protein [Methyloceanibacter sp.]